MCDPRCSGCYSVVEVGESISIIDFGRACIEHGGCVVYFDYGDIDFEPMIDWQGGIAYVEINYFKSCNP